MDRLTFSDLLRLRDSRREAVLERRWEYVKSARDEGVVPTTAAKSAATESVADTGGVVSASIHKGKDKGKGKGKGKGIGKDSGDVPDDDAVNLFNGSQGTRNASLAEITEEQLTSDVGIDEIRGSVERERSLRQAFLELQQEIGRSSNIKDISGAQNEQDKQDEHEEQKNQKLNLLSNIPSILLRNDLPSYIAQLNSEHERVLAEQESAQQAESQYGRAWIYSLCEQAARAQGSGSEEAAQTMCESVVTILQSTDDDDSIQGQLLEVVGYDNMEFLGTLVRQRAHIVTAVREEADFARVSESMALARQRPGALAVVRHARDAGIERQIRKGKHRSTGAGAGAEAADDVQQVLGSGTELRRAREAQLSQRPAQELRPARREAERLPHVYTSSGKATGGGNMLSMFGTRYALPVGTQREEFGDHEEITVPVAGEAPRRATEASVMVSSMDAVCRYTFRKYTALNRIQSIIYPTAYLSNENILLSAPTGAGKTDVALLTILRTISQYCAPAVDLVAWVGDGDKQRPAVRVDRAAFKIVYVAPMKALAAEVVDKYQSRLAWLGIRCRELTGDMQLTKAEVQATQVIVTTPEKWDVVTRKAGGDTELVDKVRLVIMDEIHLLNEERGGVLETLVARTQRHVEARQTPVRLVGLSATLPNYVDVAEFLGVNLQRGLFYFDGGFRPVPLEQHFVGVHAKPGTPAAARLLNRACYVRVQRLVAAGHQVMVFVHARKDTAATAQALREMAAAEGTTEDFTAAVVPAERAVAARLARAGSRELRELAAGGFGVHHAGMGRSDRRLAEELFACGAVRVLCCTATLAWGVNLPAYAVVIKGTQVYDAQRGGFGDLSVLDVLQIFGRAGRPQYEPLGVGYILTTHDRLAHYVAAVTMQQPIESRFAARLVDNLNAEVALGSVSSVDEGVAWLGYTYMAVRMRRNPMAYGLDTADEALLGARRREMLVHAAQTLAQLQMVGFDMRTGFLAARDTGRIAAAYYLRHETVAAAFGRTLHKHMGEADVLAAVCAAHEFAQVRVRAGEEKELAQLLRSACCCDVRGGATESTAGKCSVLLQAWVSRARIEDFGLAADAAYVAQNAARVVRALFESAVSRRWAGAACAALSLSRAMERRMWPFESALRQFDARAGAPPDSVLRRLEGMHALDAERLRDMSAAELGALVRQPRLGAVLQRLVRQVPRLAVRVVRVAPVTRSVLHVALEVTAAFEWSEQAHGAQAESFWLWVEDDAHEDILHVEHVVVRRRTLHEPLALEFTVPAGDGRVLPPQLWVRMQPDRWIGGDSLVDVPLRHVRLPAADLASAEHTDLLDLQPLPVSALRDPTLEAICRARFTHFNPVQTQVFHTLYHTAANALVGAPTGSGKTVTAELAMWHAFREHPRAKVVYVAPLKALVSERVADWRERVAKPLGRTLVELTGDVAPDPAELRCADIIVTTPEKWDGVTRLWRSREYARNVSLLILDEIHLLGADRGPILEAIVTRMHYIAAQTSLAPTRVVGLSTALANAGDLGAWLRTGATGLFNFRHSVRPVPVEMHIDAFSAKHYCPRMAQMDRPAYRAIRTHAGDRPAIIFVSSRRQTRLTAQALIAFCAVEDNPRHFLRSPDDPALLAGLERVDDPALRLALSFGIGMHHAGLTARDRQLSEQLFAARTIQVLVATSTLAWGVNLPAHLVVLKGTEYYDAAQRRYVDYPVTDVLQMVGRAGRPQFDDRAVACIFVAAAKKDFYKRFLHAPFPVESALHRHLHAHLNAEVAAGAVGSAADAVKWLAGSYLFRRLRQNPSYYGLHAEPTETAVSKHLSRLTMRCFRDLERALCVRIEPGEDPSDVRVMSTPLGRIASQYYLSHATMLAFATRLPQIEQATTTSGTGAQKTLCQLLCLLSDAAEWAELPVRHNEDLLNRELARSVPFAPSLTQPIDYLSPHVKTNILLQCHLVRAPLPSSDYTTDTRTVLDSSVRILQALVDVAAYQGCVRSTLAAIELMQAVKQACMPDRSPLAQLSPDLLRLPSATDAPRCLGDLMVLNDTRLRSFFAPLATADSPADAVDSWCRAVRSLPAVDVVVDRQARPVAQSQSSSTVSLDELRPLTQYSVTVTVRYAAVRTEFARAKMLKEPGQAYSPRFGKTQYEGWWLMLVHPAAAANDELLAIKRLSMQGRDQKGSGMRVQTRSTSLMFITPEVAGSYALTLHLASDAYLGLDQELTVNLTVVDDAQMVVPKDPSAFLTKDQIGKYQ